MPPQRHRPALDDAVSGHKGCFVSESAPVKPDHPRVAIVGCGGTISSLGTTSLDVMDYPDDGQKLGVLQVLDRVPELASIAMPVPIAFREISSSAITVADWMELRDTIQKLGNTEPAIAGIVVLHGTGTLEETAFFLHLTTDIAQPVILVGSQRPLNAIGSDAPMNLMNAVRVAAHPNSRGRGVLVVLNDEVHSARDVVKSSTYRLQAFRSPDYGMLGQVDGDGLHFFRTLDTLHTSRSPFAGMVEPAQWPRVDIVYSYIGADQLFIEAAIAAGAQGLVSAGFAPGLTTPAAKQALEQLSAKGFPVVLCSRASSGRVASRRYVVQKSMIAGGDLSPQKARILLMLCLANGFDPAQTRQAFSDV
jgi:L-asparaginase